MVLQHPCKGHGPCGRETKVGSGEWGLGKDECFWEQPLTVLHPRRASGQGSHRQCHRLHAQGRGLDGGQWPDLRVFQEPQQVGPISRSHIPMSELSNTHCWYTGADPQCKDLSWTLFVYDTKHSVSGSHVFLSYDRGYTFTHVETSTREWGVLLGLYNFISFAMTSLLIVRSGEGGAGKAAGVYFRYNGTENSHISNHSSTTFHLLHKGPVKLWRSRILPWGVS